MTTFNPNKPQPGDKLNKSQLDLLLNNQQLDISFQEDHYTFSNGTTNNGKHNQMTTPLIDPPAHHTTAPDEPKIYAMQDSANLGVLQYSRGGSDAVPTPLTSLHSGTPFAMATNEIVQLFDFTGLTYAFCIFMAKGFQAAGATNPISGFAQLSWDGTRLSCWNPTAAKFGTNPIVAIAPRIRALPEFTNDASPLFSIQNAGGSITDVTWTIQFLRSQL